MGGTDRPLILPPLRRTAKDAEAFARIVHGGQTDKAGRPYVEHVARVAARVILYGGTDDAVQIAWLHDVVEDTPYGEEDLCREDFSDDVVEGVCWLSRNHSGATAGGPYPDWIEEIAANAPLPVILVKIADVEDNADPERLALLDEPTRRRLSAKYGAALPILKDAAARLGWRNGNG